MKFFDIILGENKTQAEVARKTEEDKHRGETIYLTEDVTFGRDEIIFVDKNRGIRKTIVDEYGRIHKFPGFIKEDFSFRFLCHIKFNFLAFVKKVMFNAVTWFCLSTNMLHNRLLPF